MKIIDINIGPSGGLTVPQRGWGILPEAALSLKTNDLERLN